MNELFDKRALLITGKGGVGRTTVSASLAIAAARRGKRVLLVEIGEPDGDYSPLARIFDRERLPIDATPIGHGVRGQMLWTRLGHESFLRTVIPVGALVRAAVRSRALGRLLEAAPSFQEMGIFYLLLTLLKAERGDGQPEHDLVIFDMPATGHTLALTALPGILLELMPTGPIADAMREGQEYFYNPDTTATCVVTLPETLPVTECLELIDGLRETHMPIGPVIVNKFQEDQFTDAEREALLPLLAEHRVFGADRFLRHNQSEKAMARLRASVNVPIIPVPEFPNGGKELITSVTNVFVEGQA